MEITQIPIPHVRDNRTISPEEGIEFWVESHDGLVGGYIDYVAKSQDGPIIRDYKSGDILEESSRELKASYEIQLQLYAALYQATTGKWPAQLEVIPLQGSSVLVPFDRESCSILLEDAANTLQSINNTIASFSTSKHEVEQHLASPSASTCRYCRFRPGCAAYRAARRVANATAGWPNDITGTLEEMQKLGNAKLMITVKTDHDTSSPAFIRGVTPEPSRHPAILHLQKGDHAGFFDLSSGSSGNTFTESPLAVIYKMNA